MVNYLAHLIRRPRSWLNMAPHLPIKTRALCIQTRAPNTGALYSNTGARSSSGWLKVAPHLYEGTSPWPTTANLEAWRAPALPGAQPWEVGQLVRRQRPRPRPPQHDGSMLLLSRRQGNHNTGTSQSNTGTSNQTRTLSTRCPRAGAASWVTPMASSAPFSPRWRVARRCRSHDWPHPSPAPVTLLLAETSYSLSALAQPEEL